MKKQYGWKDLSSRTAFTLDTIMRIYSMSKVVTAAAVMLLKEQGLLSVTDPVSKYLPAYKDMTVAVKNEDGTIDIVPAERPMTIFDLLTMTSGIPYHEEGSGDPLFDRASKGFLQAEKDFRAAHKDEPDTIGFANMLAQYPLCFQPGDHWMYGYSCDVLGAVVEAASAMTCDRFLRKYLFDPLDMQDTGFSVDSAKADRIASIYLAKDHALTKKPGQYNNMDSMPYYSGGAGLFSTLGDYSHFAQMLMNKGLYRGSRIMKAESVAEIASNHLTYKQSLTYNWDDCPGYGYGYAVRVTQNSRLSCYNESNGSFGWNGAAGTSVRIEPERDLAVIFGTQRLPADHALFLPQLMKAVSKYLDM